MKPLAKQREIPAGLLGMDVEQSSSLLLGWEIQHQVWEEMLRELPPAPVGGWAWWVLRVGRGPSTPKHPPASRKEEKPGTQQQGGLHADGRVWEKRAFPTENHPWPPF